MSTKVSDSRLMGRFLRLLGVQPGSPDIELLCRIVRASYQDAATFMNSVMVRRFFADRAETVFNCSLVLARPQHTTVTRLSDRQAMVDAIVDHCLLPREIVEPAVSGLEQLRSVFD